MAIGARGWGERGLRSLDSCVCQLGMACLLQGFKSSPGSDFVDFVIVNFRLFIARLSFSVDKGTNKRPRVPGHGAPQRHRDMNTTPR